MIQKNDWFRGDETGCDWFCKHSVWISKRTLGMIIPGLFEPPVRTLRATIPENESHIFR